MGTSRDIFRAYVHHQKHALAVDQALNSWASLQRSKRFGVEIGGFCYSNECILSGRLCRRSTRGTAFTARAQFCTWSDELIHELRYDNVSSHRSSLDGAWTSDESLLQLKPKKASSHISLAGGNQSLQQTGSVEAPNRCRALQETNPCTRAENPDSVVARRRRDQKTFRRRGKVQSSALAKLLVAVAIRRNPAEFTQKRVQAACCLLVDTQKRLQQTEQQRNALQARNKILESFVFAQFRPPPAPSQSLLSAAQEVPMYTLVLQSRRMQHGCTSDITPISTELLAHLPGNRSCARCCQGSATAIC